MWHNYNEPQWHPKLNFPCREKIKFPKFDMIMTVEKNSQKNLIGLAQFSYPRQKPRLETKEVV